MLYIFKNFIKQYRLHLAFKHGVELIKKGRKEETFNELKEVDLHIWESSEKNDKKKFTLK